jgi:hypothetical protein
MSVYKLESLITEAKVIEKSFPTILELISLIKKNYDEMDENEFELLKKHMMDALYIRFEVKIAFQNSIQNIARREGNISQDEETLNTFLTDIKKSLVLQGHNRFRVLTNRVNFQKIVGSNKGQMEEMLNILGDSFTLRDLRDRFVDKNGELKTNNNGYNTVQFYRELDKVALQINATPYED